MVRASGRILKGREVKLEGKLTLDITRAETGQPRQSGTALAEPQVRIVENHPEFTVIEITCTCGTGMCLRCEHAGTETSENSQTQKKEPEVSVKAPDQTK